jgi:hypothetical protein
MMPNIAERILRLSAARRRLLEVLTDPEMAHLGPEDICRAARVARSTYWEARRDPAFLPLLEEVRESLLPRKKIELAMQIVQDALQPIATAPVSHLQAITDARRMAAAFLGLNVTAQTSVKMTSRKEVQASGSVGLLQQLCKYPTDVLEELTQTSRWPERAGRPPWLPAGECD